MKLRILGPFTKLHFLLINKKSQAALFQATRLSLLYKDPWLSVPASRRVWLFLAEKSKHTLRLIVKYFLHILKILKK
jgi:hypothetical protein